MPCAGNDVIHLMTTYEQQRLFITMKDWEHNVYDWEGNLRDAIVMTTLQWSRSKANTNSALLENIIEMQVSV